MLVSVTMMAKQSLNSLLSFLFILILCGSCGRIAMVEGSAGDNDPQFYRCVMQCLHSISSSSPLPSSSLKGKKYYQPTLSYDELFPPSKAWQIINWSSDEFCEYQCMTEISLQRQQQGYSIYKYFGHWPFQRWFGLEEPASVLFSAMNAVAHLNFLVRQQGVLITGQMRVWLISYAIIAINAWIASSLFHAKKSPFHTQYDYISALTLIGFGWLLICKRWTLTLTTTAQQSNRKWPSILFSLICFISFVGYVIRVYAMITSPDSISFDLHMKTCIGIIIITTMLWFAWIVNGLLRSTNNVNKSKKTYWICALVQIWFVIASMLEIFDFPPFYWLFDAHSLWHCATIPLGFVWYYFWSLDDCNHLSETLTRSTVDYDTTLTNSICEDSNLKKDQ